MNGLAYSIPLTSDRMYGLYPTTSSQDEPRTREVLNLQNDKKKATGRRDLKALNNAIYHTGYVQQSGQVVLLHRSMRIVHWC